MRTLLALAFTSLMAFEARWGRANPMSTESAELSFVDHKAHDSSKVDVRELWPLLVGPVSSALVTSTVAPTPLPSSSLVRAPAYDPPLKELDPSWSFPVDFWWGVASAAYQVEGAVMDEGRGPSVWDILSHRATNHIIDNSTADVADNHYYMYKEDIARLAALKVEVYSFSLSWTRIIPFGRGPVNQEGIDHYNDVINTCLEYGIEPQLTLYHWDTPLMLQNAYGGWLSEDIVPDFVAYARVAYEAFGDRVRKWYTVNEPLTFCNQYPLPVGIFTATDIPSQQQPYFCGHSVLLAHSQAYHLGKSMLSSDSSISYKNNGGYKIPLTDSLADAEAVRRSYDYQEGWMSEPIFLTGDYPVTIKEYVSSFLRPFTDHEKNRILGSADYYAHDAYTSQFVTAPDKSMGACIGNTTHPLWPLCAITTYIGLDGWPIGPVADPGASWLHKTTQHVPAFLRYIQDTWIVPSPGPAKGVAVTEFGFAEPFETQKTLLSDIITDTLRTAYYRDYMRGILTALADGVEVIGATAWSFVDNYEWRQGYSATFGMQYVNFSDPTLPRYYKTSFFEYASAFETYKRGM